MCWVEGVCHESVWTLHLCMCCCGCVVGVWCAFTYLNRLNAMVCDSNREFSGNYFACPIPGWGSVAPAVGACYLQVMDSVVPAAEESGVGVEGASVMMTFDGVATAGSGKVRLTRDGGGTPVVTDITSHGVVSEYVVTFNLPRGTLVGGVEYSVSVETTAFTGEGTEYGGAMLGFAWSFTTGEHGCVVCVD